MASSKEKITASAMKHLQKGALEKAVREFEKILEIDPNDERTLQKVGDLYTRMNRPQEALGAYRRVAELYARHGFYAKAVAVFNQILKLEPDNKELHGRLADMYQQLGLLNETAQQYRILYEYYEQSGRRRDSLEILRKLSLVDRNNLPVRVKLAEGYLKEGMHKEGLDEYERLADDLRLDDRQDEYVRVLDRMLQHFPEKVDRGKELAALYLERGETRKSLTLLKGILKERSDDVETLDLLAKAFRGLNQLAKTVTVLKELARIHQARGDNAALKAVCRRVLEIDPENPEALKGLGQSPFSTGLPGETLPPSADTGLELLDEPAPVVSRPAAKAPEPEAPNVVKLMTEAEVFVKYGLHDQAQARLRSILALDQQNIKALELLHHVCEIMEDLAGAEEVEALLDAARYGAAASHRAKPEPEPEAVLEPTIDFDQDVELIEEDEEERSAGEDVAIISGAGNDADIIEEIELPVHMRPAPAAPARKKPPAPRPPDLPKPEDIEIGDLEPEQLDELLVGDVLDVPPTPAPRPVPKPKAPAHSGRQTVELTLDDLSLVEDESDEILVEEVLEMEDIDEAETIEGLEPVGEPLRPDVEEEDPGLDLDSIGTFEAPAQLREEAPSRQGEAIPTMDLAEFLVDEVEAGRLQDVAADEALAQGGDSELVFERIDDAHPESAPERDTLADMVAFPGLEEAEEPLQADASPDDALPLLEEDSPEAGLSPEADELDLFIDEPDVLEGEDEPLPSDEALLVELPEDEGLLEDVLPGLVEAPEQPGPEPDAEPALEFDPVIDVEPVKPATEPDMGWVEVVEVEVEPVLEPDNDPEPEGLPEPTDFNLMLEEMDAAQSEALPEEELDRLREFLDDEAVDDLEEAEFFVQQAIYSEAMELYRRLAANYPGETVFAGRVDMCREALRRESEKVRPVKPVDAPKAAPKATRVSAGPPPVPGKAAPVDLSREILAGLDDEEDFLSTSPAAARPQPESHQDEIETHLNLGVAYREMGLLDEAIGEFLVAYKSGGPTVRVAVMLGLGYLQKKMPERAADFFRQAVSLPELNLERFMELRYELGLFHQEAGRLPEALRQFKMVEDIDPEFRDVAHLVRSLEADRVEPAMPDLLDEILDGVDVDRLPDDYAPDKTPGDKITYV